MRIGSAEQEQAIAKLENFLIENQEDALKHFADLLEASLQAETSA